MDAKDYNYCVNEYADALYRFLVRGYADEESAKDIIQNVFMKLWEKREDLNVKEVKSYLFVMAKNRAIDMWRKNHRIIAMDESHEKVTYRSQDSFEQMDYVKYCLRDLTEDQKTLILLKDYEGYTYDDMAQMLGLTLSQVKINLFRARKKLQVALKKKAEAV